jgi:hypothetical protein
VGEVGEVGEVGMTAGENSGVAAGSACAQCGSAVTHATSYLTEVGLLCWPCFGKFQNKQQLAERNDADLQRSLTRRAKSLAGLHWVMWGAVMLIVTDHTLPDGARSVLLLVIAGLGIGLLLRQRWAYEAAIALDAAGILGLVALAIVERRPIILVADVFPVALLALTWALRSAYAEQSSPLIGVSDAPREHPENSRTPALRAGAASAPPPAQSRRSRRLVLLVAVLAAVAGGGTTLYLLRRPRPLSDPALALMRTTVPRWQIARARSSSPAGPDSALVAGARRWPALAAAFEALDRSWPDEAPVRAAAASANRALADAGLPYFASVWMVNDRPYVLTHELVARVAWHVGAQSIEVLRLRRLDDLSIDFAFDGVTQGGLPVVMLDRVEATLAREIPVMYAAAREVRSSQYNDFDRAVLARLRSFLEARVGPGFARTALALRERDRLLEEMRTRFHGDEVKLAVPERFVLGDDWLDELKPSTRLDRRGGPLFLDTDLKALAQADRALRDPSATEAFRDAIEVTTLNIEAHEARHAAEASEPAAPPPAALFEVMPDSSTRMVGWSDSELQAFLGELHDSPVSACANLAGMMRTVYGVYARREPHFYATLALLKQLGADEEQDPAQQLSALCAVPDGEMRSKVAAMWRRLYGAPLAAGTRTPAGAAPKAPTR